MRNLLLLLVLANVLYFMWNRFVESPDETGVVVVDETTLGPPLKIADPRDANVQRDENSAGLAIEPIELAAAIGRTCVTVGPFKTSADAEAALGEFRDEGMSASLRTTQGQVFIGHWVQIRNIPDRETGNRMLETLRAGGLGESYLVPTEDEGLKISLGLFGEMSRAERIELQAKSLDLPADITPRMRDATVYFVDVGLPPARGAGAMIEQYGEDNVLLRDRANCPRPD